MTSADSVRPKLRPRTLRPLALGQVKPRGWLADVLTSQLDGMAGHLDEIWPDVGESAWIGGSAEGWERGPYWLDAAVPLAALTGDARLQEKVRIWIDALLDSQDETGWMAPYTENSDLQHSQALGHHDVWPRMVILKALLQQDAATSDERIPIAALRLTRRIKEILEETPLDEWGKARWADLVLSCHELYEHFGEDWLLDLAELAHQQGYSWSDFARNLPYRGKFTEQMLRTAEVKHGRWFNDHMLATHGVNVAMGLKAMPVRWRHGAEDERAAFQSGLRQLDEHHGQATGLFTCDEHLAGTSPSQGTETCTVVEYLYSLEVALSVWGVDEAIVDRWERIAYNALPASSRDSETGHQYDQQANQVICHVTEDRIYTNNGPDANIFGFAPHFGCCTANRHQGWPKFVAHLWMATDDGGLASLSYAPSVIETALAERTVRVEVCSDYPFEDTVRISVTAQEGANFPLHLRIPEWTRRPTAHVDGEKIAAESGTTLSLRRNWEGTHEIELHFPAPLTAIPRPSGALALRRGPVLFALAVEEGWHRLGGEAPYDDWEVHPESPWNYAILVDPQTPDATLVEQRRPLAGSPFSRASAPVSLIAKARRLPEWRMAHGAAAPPPPSPVNATGPDEGVTLLPYGAARLRVTDLPWTPAASSD